MKGWVQSSSWCWSTLHQKEGVRLSARLGLPKSKTRRAGTQELHVKCAILEVSYKELQFWIYWNRRDSCFRGSQGWWRWVSSFELQVEACWTRPRLLSRLCLGLCARNFSLREKGGAHEVRSNSVSSWEISLQRETTPTLGLCLLSFLIIFVPYFYTSFLWFLHSGQQDTGTAARKTPCFSG